jgi:hypothetical protein
MAKKASMAEGSNIVRTKRISSLFCLLRAVLRVIDMGPGPEQLFI